MISSLNLNQSLQTDLVAKSNKSKTDPNLKTAQKSDRVAEITKMIADGSYKLDVSKTAKAVAETLI